MRSIAAFAVRRAPVVLLLWLVVIAGFNVLVPQLDKVIAHDTTAFIPSYATSMKAFRDLDREFGDGHSQAFAFVAVERRSGITQRDELWLQSLTAKLAADPTHFSGVPDLTQPGMLDALLSKDHQALYLQIGLPGPVGAPQTDDQVKALRAQVALAPPGLTAYVTGTPATIADTQNSIQHSIAKITLITVVLIGVILLLLYRSIPMTVAVLSFIGAALGLGRGVVALAGEHHLFHVSTFTASFVTAIVLGASTDYAIFLLSRFHELRRAGVEAHEATRQATVNTASVIVGSALTVALALASMAFAHIAMFHTTGPAVSLAILSTLALSLTFLPALMAFAGPRGWLDPKPQRAEARWSRLGDAVVSKPARVLAWGLIPLLLLALFFPFAKVSYDQRRTLPAGEESTKGYQLLDRHFPPNEVLADYIVIRTDRNVRNSTDLAFVEKAAGAAAAVPGVASVRTVTRPLGTPLTQASLAYQMRQAGRQLGAASTQVAHGAQAGRQLNSGAEQLSAGASKAASGAQRILTGANQLASGLPALANGATSARDGSAQLQAGAHLLATSLSTGADQAQVAVSSLGLAYSALQQSPFCGLDPYCARARAGIGQIYAAERDRLVPGMRQAAAAASRIASGAASLTSGLSQLQTGLIRADAGAAQLRSGQALLASKLGDLAQGAGQVASGTGQIASKVSGLGSGLSSASTFLQGAGSTATRSRSGGFYLPPAAFRDPRFATASTAFVSSDGKAVRMIAVSATNAFGNAAMDRVPHLAAAVKKALAGTPLAGARVEVTGLAAADRDIQTLAGEDFDHTALTALIVVLIILLLLLRSLLVSVFLLASVVLSYAAAVGLGVLVWQDLLGKPLDWTIPSIAFVLLVAVGADYNMLLVKRIHDEAPNGEKHGIAHAVSVTGSVITAAGLIFAASIFAMMAGNVLTLQQLGFTIGMGLLLDTFIVRTLVVPAFATLMGRNLWWPSNRGGTRGARATAEPVLVPAGRPAVPPPPPREDR
ncbi:MAG: MMPL family transporter [Marmoricola sp.]